MPLPIKTPALLISALLGFSATARAADSDPYPSPDNQDATARKKNATPARKKDAAPAKKKKSGKVIVIGDRIGVLHNGPAAASSAKPGAPQSAQSPTVAELQSELEELRARTAALEEAQRDSHEQTRLLQQMSEQLRAIHAQLANSQDDRTASASAAAARDQDSQQAIDGLGGALAQLASGDDNVADAIDAADQSFPPQARRDLAAAREALQTRNLSLARGLLQAAISDAQAGR